MSRIEQALGTEATFGSAGIAPEENCHDPLQPALDPVHPASLVSFFLRTSKISCTRVKNSTSFWSENGQELNLFNGVGVGLGF